MADGSVLTQREIDNLLKVGGSDSADEPAAEVVAAEPKAARTSGVSKTVKPYDFRHPDKFSKEQLRTLQAVHETFARLAASTLSNQLRTNVEIRVSSIDQGLYEEYIYQTNPSGFINVIRMAPLDGSIAIEYGSDLGMVTVDRLLGGTGVLMDRGHEVTDIEIQLLRSMGAQLAENIGEAWENLSAVQPTITDLHQDIQLVQLAPPTEVVIMVFMEVTALDVVAGMSVCTPFNVLEPILQRLNAQVWAGTGGRLKSTAESQANLRSQIERAPTQLVVELGHTMVRTRDLGRLRVGDVIRLDGISTRAIPISMGKIRKWFGRPGVVSGRMAVDLERWAPEEMPAAAAGEAAAAAQTDPAAVETMELASAPDAVALTDLDESENAHAA